MGEFVAYAGTTDNLFEIAGDGASCDVRPLDPRVGGSDMEGVRAILVDQHHPRRLYVGTQTDGVQRSRDGGASWEPASEGMIHRNVWALAQHSATGDLYVGTEPASVFRSTDGGDSWEDLPMLRTLPETKEWWFPMPPHVAHVRGITLQADDPSDIFCAIEDGWLVRSRDGGESWRQVRAGVHCDAHMVTVVPDDPSIVYVSTGNYGFRSTDGGATFVDARQGLDRGYMAGVVVHPARPNVLLTAASHPPGAWFRPGNGAETEVYRSRDAGLSWKRVVEGLEESERWGTWAIAGDPVDPDTAFVGFFDGRIFVTQDGGDSFREIGTVEGPLLTMAAGQRG